MSLSYNADEVFDQEAPKYFTMQLVVKRRNVTFVENKAATLRLVASAQPEGFFTKTISIVGEQWNLGELLHAMSLRGIAYQFTLEA